VTGGSCAFVIDDIDLLALLATRAIDAGLIDGFSDPMKADFASAARVRAQVSQPIRED
jgi:hypothetical protein